MTRRRRGWKFSRGGLPLPAPSSLCDALEATGARPAAELARLRRVLRQMRRAFVGALAGAGGSGVGGALLVMQAPALGSLVLMAAAGLGALAYGTAEAEGRLLVSMETDLMEQLGRAPLAERRRVLQGLYPGR